MPEEPDLGIPTPNLGPVLSAGVMATGASLLFPSYGAAGLTAGAVVMPIAVVLGAGTLGWYLGKWIFNSRKEPKEIMDDANNIAAVAPATLEAELHTPTKEWAKTVQQNDVSRQR